MRLSFPALQTPSILASGNPSVKGQHRPQLSVSGLSHRHINQRNKFNQSIATFAIAMDPISISGTIITVLQLTSSVISKCYNYRQGIGSSASSNALKITKALNELEDVSEALLRTVERASQEGAAQFAAIKLLAKENGVLEHCVTVLGALEGVLGAGKEGGRKEWPFDEGKIERIEEELNGVVGTMRLALTACQA